MKQKSFLICFLILVLTMVSGFSIYAAEDPSEDTSPPPAQEVNQAPSQENNQEDQAIKGIPNNGEHMKQWRNYQLDIKPLNFMNKGDGILNEMANVVFNIIKILSYLTVTLFYFSMKLNLAEIFSSQIDSIQSSTMAGIFDPFVILGLAVAFFGLVVKFIKQNLTGMIIDFGKILLVFIISYFVVAHSGTALKAATSITKDMAMAALLDNTGNIVSETGKDEYALNTTGVIWDSLVHTPWLYLEFDNTNPTQEEVNQFLTTSPSNKKNREEIVNTYMQIHGEEVFAPERGVSRLGFLCIYLLAGAIKAAVYLGIAIMQLAFQLLSVFFVLLAPVILILSFFPNFGFNTVSWWFKKLLETQVMIVIITFLLGIIIMLDDFLLSLIPTWGWLAATALGAIVTVIIFFKSKKIIQGFERITTSLTNPEALRANFENTSSNTVRMTGNLARNAAILSIPPAGAYKYVFKPVAKKALEIAPMLSVIPEPTCQTIGAVGTAVNRVSLSKRKESDGTPRESGAIYTPSPSGSNSAPGGSSSSGVSYGPPLSSPSSGKEITSERSHQHRTSYVPQKDQHINDYQPNPAVPTSNKRYTTPQKK